MILKFQHNLRADKDSNVSVSSEQIVDGEHEAELAGRDFATLSQAFLRGYAAGLEEQNTDTKPHS